MIGNKFFKQYCKQQSYAGNKLEYFIEKYGEKEGTKKYNKVCSQKSLSLTNFIRKYGDEEGKAKYKEYLRRTSIGYSKESQELFQMLDKKIGKYAIENSFFYLKNYEQEISIDLGNCKSKVFKLDYVLSNKVIEFNGDFWHANPLIYKANDVIPLKNKPMLVSDIWKHDQERLQKIEDFGYKVLVVWENEYISNIEQTIQKCLEFLRS